MAAAPAGVELRGYYEPPHKTGREVLPRSGSSEVLPLYRRVMNDGFVDIPCPPLWLANVAIAVHHP